MLSDDSLARLRQLAADVHAAPAIDAARVDTLALGIVQLLDDLAEVRRQRDALRDACEAVMAWRGDFMEWQRVSEMVRAALAEWRANERG